MFKIQDSINEKLTLKKLVDKFNQNRIIVVSDNPNPREATNETYKTKDIFKRYGASWDKYDNHWFWNDRFKGKDEIAKSASDAVREANALLGNQPTGDEPSVFDNIEDLVKAKEYIQTVKGAYEFVKSKSGKITLDLIDEYINQLADSLNDKKLLDDIADFNRAAKAYILDTGKYSYSFFNTWMIWLQSSRGAHEFGSIPYWYGRGYEPIPNAKQIMILKPGNTGSLYNNVKQIIKDHPNSPEEFSRETSFKITDRENPIPKEKYNAFWNWGLKKGYAKQFSTNQFKEVAIYDDLNVQAIPGKEQINQPEGLKWYNDDDTEDDKAKIMILALKEFCNLNGINVTVPDNKDLGGARGVSSGGHIQLVTDSLGAGILATFIHEIAHELLHQANSKNIANGKLYLGRDNTSEERELHAESISYTVMKSYDFPIEHSINYLAHWKSNKDKIKKFQKVIRDTSLFIIQQIEKYAPEAEEKETQGELQETMVNLKSIIREFKQQYL